MKRAIILLSLITYSIGAYAQDTCKTVIPFANKTDTLFLNTGFGWQNRQLFIPLVGIDTTTGDELGNFFSIDSSGWSIQYYESYYDTSGLYISFRAEDIMDSSFDLIVDTNAFLDSCGYYNSSPDTVHIVVVPPILTAAFLAKQNDDTISITDYSTLAESVYYVLTNTSNDNTIYFNSRNPTFQISGGILYKFCQVAINAKDSSFYCIYIDLNLIQLAVNQPEQDCAHALQVCDSIYIQLNSYTGPGLNKDELPGYYDGDRFVTTQCIQNGENNSVWYTFATRSAGYLQFVISPLDITDDYDFALFDITGHTCADIHAGLAPEVRCNYTLNSDNYCDSTGIGYSGYDTISGAAGPAFNAPLYVDSSMHVFALLVNNFTSGGDGYVLDFSGSTTKIGGDSVVIRFAQQNDTICAGSNILDIALSIPVLESLINPSAFMLNGPKGLNIVQASPVDTLNELTNIIQLQFNDTLPPNTDLQIILQANTLASICGKTSVVTDTLHVHTTVDGAFLAFSYYISNQTLHIFNQSNDTNVYYLLTNQFSDSSIYMQDTSFVVLNNDYGYYNVCQYSRDNQNCSQPPLCKTINYTTTGISSPAGDNDIALYPNPTTGLVHVNLPDLIVTTYLQVYNVLGSLISRQETQAGTTSTEIDLGNAPAGTYFLKVMLPNKQQVFKVVKF